MRVDTKCKTKVQQHQIVLFASHMRRSLIDAIRLLETLLQWIFEALLCKYKRILKAFLVHDSEYSERSRIRSN